jgi:AhpD family alkylhydroperoxidase
MFESVEEFRDLRKRYNGKMFASGVPIFREFEEMEGRVLQSGALDRKYKELIGIATSIVSSCYGCIEYHTAAAQAAGATRQEIMETVAVALMMGGGPAQWPARYAFKVLDELKGST